MDFAASISRKHSRGPIKSTFVQFKALCLKHDGHVQFQLPRFSDATHDNTLAVSRAAVSFPLALLPENKTAPGKVPLRISEEI